MAPPSVGRFLIGYPGALCGMAFTGGVLAQIDSRPAAWSAVVATVCAFLLWTCCRRAGPRGTGETPQRWPCLQPKRAPRSKLSRIPPQRGGRRDAEDTQRKTDLVSEEEAPQHQQNVSEKTTFSTLAVQGDVARRLVVAVVFFLLGASRYRATVDTHAFPAPSSGSPMTIIGTVTRPPLEETGGATGNTHTSLELDCGAWPRALRVIAPTPLSGVRGGDTIRVVGSVSLPADVRNPGEIADPQTFSVQVRLRENVQLVPFDGNYRARAIGRVRQHLYDVVSRVYTAPTRGYVLSILLGDRRLLAPRLRDALLYTGTFHFLAISGLHLGLLMFVVLRVPLPPRWRLTVRLVFLATFTVLTGANPPVLRAAVLFALTLLSASGARCPRPLNTLGWTALLLLSWNPQGMADVGFQLSFVAVLALTVVHPRLWSDAGEAASLRRRLREVETRLAPPDAARQAAGWLSGAVRWARSSLAVSTTAYLGTSPLILHHFHRVHLLAPLWNLLAYPFTFVSLLGGAISLAVGCVHPTLARPVALVVDGSVDAMAWLLERAGSVPGSTVHMPRPGPLPVLLSYALLGSWITLRHPARRIAVGLLLLTVAATAALLSGRRPDVWTFDHRHGGTSLIALHRTEALLVDVAPGSRSSREAELLARAVLATGHGRLRALALTHPGGASAHTVATLRDRLRIEEVWISPRFPSYPAGRGTIDQLARQGVRWRTVGRGTRLVSARDENATIEVVYPQRGDGLLERVDGRDTSLVFRLTRGGRHAIFAGAVGDAGVARLLTHPEEVRADVLVYPRGGAERRLGDALLEAVDPEYVILIGRGAERERALARRIARSGPRVFATWRRGTVVTEWTPERGWVPRYWAD